MKPKKSKRDQSESSSESESGSGSGSSSESSADHKKSNKSQKSRKKSPEPEEPTEKSKSKQKQASTSSTKGSRRDAEHSKWDSPSEKRRSGDNERRTSVERRGAEKGKGRPHDQAPNRQERDRNTRDDRRANRSYENNDQRRDNRDGQRAHGGDRGDDRRRHDHGKRQEYDRYDDRRDNRGGGYRRNDDRNRSPRRDNSRQRSRRSRSRSFDHRNATWGKSDNNVKNDRKSQQEKQKPNFALSGKLAEETNTFKGVIIKYSEPLEARKPKRRWRLYPFKGEKAMQVLYIHRESAYLIGRDRKVVDLPIDHPSCSKQHAALQYRLVPFTRENGSTGKRVRPYVIDLESANGTFLNQQKIEPKKYVELFEKDVLKFGFSSREYVLLHENSKDEAQDDDVKVEEDGQEPPVKQEVKDED